MTKITSILAGLAVVASASIVPAFAQGALTSPPSGSTFSFFTSGTSFFATGANVGYNPKSGTDTSTSAAFNLIGTQVSGNLYSVSSLFIAPNASAGFSETNPLLFLVTSLPSGTTAINSIGAASDGTSINLSTPAAVPEASTVVSFGALLALGGLAVVLRRKGVKNAV